MAFKIWFKLFIFTALSLFHSFMNGKWKERTNKHILIIYYTHKTKNYHYIYWYRKCILNWQTHVAHQELEDSILQGAFQSQAPDNLQVPQPIITLQGYVEWWLCTIAWFSTSKVFNMLYWSTGCHSYWNCSRAVFTQ